MNLSARTRRNVEWIETYLRIPDGKFVGKPVVLTDEQLEWMEMLYGSPTRTFILSMARKNGKALALDTPIPTPNGWVSMRDVSVGDYVYDTNGVPVKVIGESEIFKDKRCYRLTFSDGSTIVASEDHLWTTRHKYRPWAKPSTYANGKVRGSSGGIARREVLETVTTKQIHETLTCPRKDGKYEANHKIDIAKKLLSKDVDLPIPPYVLGIWLGDGTSACSNITCGDKDVGFISKELNKLLQCDVVCVKWRDKANTIRLAKTGIHKKLRENNLLNNKNIPDIYFNSSHEQRLHLLQGLMDSDGTVSKNGGITTARCSFSNTNYKLAYGVWRIARSLGFKATIKESDAKLNGRFISKCWDVSFTASKNEQIFRLERKQSLLPSKIAKRSGTLTITRCDYVGVVPTKCIAVDSQDHLYLAGHGCVPTHNTTISAMLLLLHLCGAEAKPNSELYSAAQSRDQASVLFNYAAKMVRMSPDLSSYVGIRDSGKQIYCKELGTLYRALSADASTAYGLNPALVIHDELGQVKGERFELYDALETAAGAQPEPLSIIISTQAPTDGDLLSILIDDALSDKSPDSIKCALYTAPKEGDPFCVESIRLANPHFDIMNKDEVLKQAEDARRLPAKEASYRNLILNQRVEAKSPFVTKSVWDENGAEPILDGFEEWYCGLDLSATRDLTAFVMVSNKYDVLPVFWLPEEGLLEKSLNDRVPYDRWHRDGYLLATEGRSIEYEHVADYILNALSQYRINKIAFDRYNMKFLKPYFIAKGMSEEQFTELFVDFGQGFISMSPALRELESALLQKKLKHGGHPILTMCAANARVVSDPAENRKFTKEKSSGRIDGMVALAMAVGVMPNQSDEAQFTEYLRNAIGT